MAGVSRAAEPGGAREFTIDELVERALRENPELQAAHAEVEAAWKNLQVVRQTYELGRHPLLDVIAEQRRYIEVEMGHTDVLKHAYDAVVELERALAIAPR
jgi:outer membrane protein TolC